MLVGDSVMRNQWESLVCLVEAVIPGDKKLLSSNGAAVAFHAMVINKPLTTADLPA